MGQPLPAGMVVKVHFTFLLEVGECRWALFLVPALFDPESAGLGIWLCLCFWGTSA